MPAQTTSAGKLNPPGFTRRDADDVVVVLAFVILGLVTPAFIFVAVARFGWVAGIVTAVILAATGLFAHRLYRQAMQIRARLDALSSDAPADGAAR